MKMVLCLFSSPSSRDARILCDEVRYINRDRFPIKRISVVDVFAATIPGYQRKGRADRGLCSSGCDCAQSGLWEIDFSWSEESAMTLLHAEKESTAGDTKY